MSIGREAMMKADVIENPMDSNEALAEMAMQRSSLYSFLASIFRQEVTAQDLRQIRSPAFEAALMDEGINLNLELEGLGEDGLVEQLAVEYTALFLGPGPNVSPHESVYTKGGGGLWGEATAQVKRFIEDAGFEYAADFTAMPDHLSVELDFMAQLTEHEAEARRADDEAQVINCMSYEQAFLNKHLGTWVAAWSEQVSAKAEISFYPELAQLTANFVAEEKLKIPERRAR